MNDALFCCCTKMFVLTGTIGPVVSSINTRSELSYFIIIYITDVTLAKLKKWLSIFAVIIFSLWVFSYFIFNISSLFHFLFLSFLPYNFYLFFFSMSPPHSLFLFFFVTLICLLPCYSPTLFAFPSSIIAPFSFAESFFSFAYPPLPLLLFSLVLLSFFHSFLPYISHFSHLFIYLLDFHIFMTTFLVGGGLLRSLSLKKKDCFRMTVTGILLQEYKSRRGTENKTILQGKPLHVWSTS